MALNSDPDNDVNIKLQGVIPHGVIVRTLPILADHRGSLAEAFRQTWVDAPGPPLQWNIVTSGAGVMRGMHIHLGFFEYYVVLQGRTTVGYRDTRPGSPTEGQTGMVEVFATPTALAAIAAPPGIAHGIYTHEPTIMLTAMTQYWDIKQEVGCHWEDPALEIPWPFKSAVVSERDDAQPLLCEVQHLVPAFDPEARIRV